MRTIRSWLLMLSALSFLATGLPAYGQSPLGNNNDFLPVDQAFKYSLQDNNDGTVTLLWDIAPGYYLYRDRMKVEGNNTGLNDVSYPSGKTITDEFFGDSEVYFNLAELLITTGDANALKLTWQGCAKAGLCYPPQTVRVDFSGQEVQAADISGPGSNGDVTSAAASNELAEDQSLASQLAGSGLIWNLVIFFGLGLLLVFTPCVLPMIPILSAVIVGSDALRGRAFILSLVFVVAMAITYALLGVAAALAGANLQAMLQAPLFIAPLAVIFVLLALSMFGLYELQLPAFIRDRLDQVNSKQKGGSLSGAAVMGFISALLASPCMTAPLAGALIYIADSGNASFGGLALLALGLGMGAPLIALATIGSGLLPKPGAWMNGVKAVFGFILLGTAVWFLERILDDPLILALWGALALALGLSVRQVVNTQSTEAPLKTLMSSTGAVITLWGALMVIGAAAGGTQLWQPLATLAGSGNATPAASKAHARFDSFKSVNDLNRAVESAGSKGQWTLVDFYADWCISCKVIEKEVFGDPEIVEALSDMQLLRADVTANDKLDQELMRKLQVVGPPTILIIGPDGQEYRAQRTIGEVSARQFLNRLAAARQS
ncbi:thiol:disulfide interchange protein DsbD [Marinobacter sp. LV10R510-11A]|nr:protein-disulfide reductase DsbD [Marinobacter sp. LV10R510-11A]SOB75896.1 thiol:disulfide interchange protein DsbD [Marinobacter sp. LV10R510-11A]